MIERTVEVSEKNANSKEKIKNDSNIHQRDDATEAGDDAIKIEKIFDYLIPTEEEPTPFNFDLRKSNNLNIYEESGEYKYAICILLKNNSNINCGLLEKTIEGIINNLEGLKTLEIEKKDIYVFIFVNKIRKNGFLVKEESIKTINREQCLKIPVKIKTEEEDENKMKIDIICKKHEMTPIESLKCFYNYCVSTLKREDQFIITSVITAGVYPYENSLKKLIQISCLSFTQKQNNNAHLDIVIPSLEVKESKDFFIKVAQYDRAHFNLYNMSFYSSTAAVPISSLLNTMIIDKKLLDDLNSYYKIININSSIDYHDYNLSLFLYRNLHQINYYYDEPLGFILYDKFTFMDYKDNWVDKFSGYYGNFFSILNTFTFCNNILKNIFMFFQIIGLILEFIYPALSIMVIYSIFYEAFNIYDKSPAIFMTLLYLIMYLGSGVCSVISNKSAKIKLTNYFFYIFMEVYYLFILICSIPAMDNIKKRKTNEINLIIINDSLYTFNSAACACLIIFTLIIAILPIIFKISVISKNIVQMVFYFFLGAPSSTSTFLIAKLWRAPETSGGNFKEERKGIMIIFFFLFNLFIGFLSFYNFNREKRANAVMGLAIFYLIYLFFKIIAIIFPLLSVIKLENNNEDKIRNILSSSEKNILGSKIQLAQSNANLKANEKDNENDDDNDNNNENNNEENNSEKEEKLDNSNNEDNNKEEQEKNEENNNSRHNESQKKDDEEVKNSINYN